MSDAIAIVQEVESSRHRLSTTAEADTGDAYEISNARCLCDSPLVSVEVLAYNHAWSLRRCIDSIVKQKVDFQFEIIIGNDCSSDETQIVAEALQVEHPELVRIVTTRRNVGLNRNARNVRRLMRGKYAAFCEADDWWAVEDKLQRQVDRMELNPKLSLLHGLACYYDEIAKVKREVRYRFPRKSPSFEWIFDESYRIETAGVICKVSDLKRIYQEMPDAVGSRFLMHDTQIFTALSRLGDVECEQRVVSVRSFSGRSLSRNSDVLSALKYHDNAFAMKMMLCDLYKVGKWDRVRSANLYLSSAIEMLRRFMSWLDAIRAAQHLWPEWSLRILLMGVIPRPHNAFLKKVYNHYIFPCAKYRNAFG